MTHVQTPTKTLLATGGLDLTSGTMTAYLLDGSYTPDPADSQESDIPAGARLAETTVTNRSVSGGDLTCDDLVYAETPTSGTAVAVAFVIGSTLVGVIDEFNGLPPGGWQAPLNGSTVTIRWQGAPALTLNEA